MSKKTYQGGCHCKAIRFEATLDLDEDGVSRCNCSVCTMRMNNAARARPADFKLLSGEEAQSFYEWGGKIGRYYFCKHCGINVYGAYDLPQMGGAWMSVNANVLDDVDPETLKVRFWDGRHNNWQAGLRDRPWPVHA